MQLSLRLKPSSLSVPMIWCVMPCTAIISTVAIGPGHRTLGKHPRCMSTTRPHAPMMYQTSPHGLNLLQWLSSKLLYDVVVIARGLRHSREPVFDGCRINACWLLCCSQLLLE